ncbi:sulfurtransferase [Natronosalvus rutilus]|uniref:Sulfurtransferase n=1 Tax=Natronosalvus rutilus TaxID=2953753 RepID=A0A9E7N8V7_9EURY|nr:sulfurtransferase [Natronosalvus rutilus]UTF53924.1 sulfurtransferase [Natronosalvus rutilus]
MSETIVASVDWLEDHREDPSVRLLDVRDAWEFDGIGHLPEAVNVPFDEFRDRESDDPGTLPGQSVVESLLGSAGVESAETVVVYDDTYGVFAARVLVTLQLYGHDDVRLLETDYSGWAREHETSQESTAFEETVYEARPLDPDHNHEPDHNRDTSPLVDAETIEAVLEEPDSNDHVLVDTREREEFETGHLPGAVRFDWRSTVDEDRRRLKPRDDLEELFADHGITPDKRVILYCNTARRISHTYVVLRWLGFERVGFYEGSLTEWEARDGVIERGASG